MSLIQIELSFTDLIRKRPTIIFSKYSFSFSLFELPLQLISCCLLSTLRMFSFYKVFATALRAVIVLNCSNLELGSIHHTPSIFNEHFSRSKSFFSVNDGL